MNHIVESKSYAALKTKPYALALFAYLSAENGPNAEFWIAYGLADALGWPRRAIQDGRRTLLELGVIDCIRPRSQGRPAVYRWRTVPISDLPYLVSNPSSPSPYLGAPQSRARPP